MSIPDGEQPPTARGKTITNDSGRIVIIGDVHGDFTECLELLDKCQVTSRDTVIFTGDLIDRGADNDKCVDLAMNHECVLGNHENRHLSYHDNEISTGVSSISNPDHIHTHGQLRPEHYEYFKSLPHFIRAPQYNIVVVHAGVFPGRKIEDQKVTHLLHAQMIEPERSERSKWPSKVPANEKHWTFWSNVWDGPERIVFGHSVLDKPMVTDKAIGLDGGCCFGHQLWALCLPDFSIQMVDSHHPQPRTEKTYAITETINTY